MHPSPAVGLIAQAATTGECLPFRVHLTFTRVRKKAPHKKPVGATYKIDVHAPDDKGALIVAVQSLKRQVWGVREVIDYTVINGHPAEPKPEAKP